MTDSLMVQNKRFKEVFVGGSGQKEEAEERMNIWPKIELKGPYL